MGKSKKRNEERQEEERQQKGSKKQQAAPVKKKRSCCCTCCITVLVLFIVIVAAGIGVGWYFGDKYTKQFFDMSLLEVTGVTNSLYFANDKKVVKNAPSDYDLQVFYSELKEQLFLKDDVVLDLSDIADRIEQEEAETIAVAVTNILRDTVATATVADDVNPDGYYDEDGIWQDTAPTEGSSSMDALLETIQKVLIDYLCDTFVADNIDKEKLNGYLEDEAALNDFVFSLQDRSLCAFVNELIEITFEMEKDNPEVKPVLDQLANYGISNPLDCVKVKEITFSKSVNQNEVGEYVDGVTTVGLTLWVGLEDTVRNAAKKVIPNALTQVGQEWLNWVATPAGWFIDMLLPKNIYLSAEIGLTESTTPEIVVNGMTGETKANAYKLINGIGKLVTESEFDLQNLVQTTSDQPLAAFRSVAGILEYDEKSEGRLVVDFYSTVIEMTGINEGKENEEDKITKRDMLSVLDTVLASNPDAQLATLKDYTFTNWYRTASGEVVYKTTPDEGDVRINYTDEFIHELARAFGLNIPDSMSTDDVIRALGFDLSGEGSGIDVNFLTGLVQRDNIRALANEDMNNLGLHITDRMLGSIVSSQFNALLDDLGYGNYGFSLVCIGIKGVDARTHFEIAIALDTAQLIDMLADKADQTVGRLVGGLLPSEVILTIETDITTNVTEYDKTTVMFNDKSAESVFDVLAGVGVMNVDEMIDGFMPTVREMVFTLADTLDATFVGSTEQADGAVVLPDVFTFIAKTAMTDDDGNYTVAPEELQNLVLAMYETSSFEEIVPSAENGELNLVKEIGDKYYIDVDNIETFAALTTHLQENVASADGFDMNTFNILPHTATPTLDDYKKSLAYDTRTIEELSPVIAADWLQSIIYAQVGEEMKEKFEILSVTTKENEIVLTLAFEVSKILGSTGALNTFMNVMPEMLYATADVHTSAITRDDGVTLYPTTLIINEFNETDSDALSRLISIFDATFTFDTYSDMIGENVYMGFTQMQNIMGEDGFNVTANGIRLQNVYTFIKDNTNLKESEFTASDIKASLQGLYERPDIEGNEVFVNNFASSDFLVNVYNGDVTPDYLKPKGDLTLDAPVSVTGSLIYTDMQLNAVLNDTRSSSYQNSLDSIQNIILSGETSSGLTNEAKINKYKSWLTGYSVAPENPDDAIMYVTLKFDLNHMQNVPQNLTALIAGDLYATVAFSFEYNTDHSKIVVNFEGMRINSLNDSAKNLVFTMLGISENDLMNAQNEAGESVPITETFENALQKVFAGAQGIALDYKPNDLTDNGGKSFSDGILGNVEGVPVDGIGIVTLPVNYQLNG